MSDVYPRPLFETSAVLQIHSLSFTSKSLFLIRLSKNLVASLSSFAGIGVALSAKAETFLVDWVTINSRLCVFRLEISTNVRTSWCEKRYLLISNYSSTDFSLYTIKNEFYYQSSVLQKVRSTIIVVLTGDLNAQVKHLTRENRLGGRFRLAGFKSDNGDRLLLLCSDYNLFLSITNYWHSHPRSATRSPLSVSQTWTQTDHIAISYRWNDCVQDSCSFWIANLNSDNALFVFILSYVSVANKFTILIGSM